MKATITIEIDTDRLRDVNDSYLAQCWHVAQANPAPSEDREAGELAEKIGREIIRRWLKGVSPELYNHQGTDHYWNILKDHGHWIDGGKTWVPELNAAMSAGLREELSGQTLQMATESKGAQS